MERKYKVNEKLIMLVPKNVKGWKILKDFFALFNKSYIKLGGISQTGFQVGLLPRHLFCSVFLRRPQKFGAIFLKVLTLLRNLKPWGRLWQKNWALRTIEIFFQEFKSISFKQIGQNWQNDTTKQNAKDNKNKG